MWWEYLIIFAGLGLATGYVLWTFLRSFRAKGNCCGTSCSRAPSGPQESPSPKLRITPLVELGPVKHADRPDEAESSRK